MRARAGSARVDTATRMLEFSFENLAWGDVVERVRHGVATTDVVLSLLRSRGAAEEKYAKALRDLAGTGPGGGAGSGGGGGGGGGGMLSAFNMLLSNKVGVSTDHGTLYAALEASKQGAREEATQRAQYATLLAELAEEVAALRSTQQANMRK